RPEDSLAPNPIAPKPSRRRRPPPCERRCEAQTPEQEYLMRGARRRMSAQWKASIPALEPFAQRRLLKKKQKPIVREQPFGKARRTLFGLVSVWLGRFADLQESPRAAR